MDRATRLGEPVVDRHEEQLASIASSTGRRVIGPSFFTLSGGILKREPRASNRIDSVLTRMIEDSSAASHSTHVDKNLDYIHTCLQLDMISMAALDAAPEPEAPLEGTPPETSLAAADDRERLQV